MCTPCNTAYARERRKPRIKIGIVQLEDVDTGKDAFAVVGIPNRAAVKAGWSEKAWGPYKSLGAATKRAKHVSDALDAWAPLGGEHG